MSEVLHWNKSTILIQKRTILEPSFKDGVFKEWSCEERDTPHELYNNDLLEKIDSGKIRNKHAGLV